MASSLDAARAATAAAAGINTVHGSTFDTHSQVERFSLLYLNPPYDRRSAVSQIVAWRNSSWITPFSWLRIGGVLVFVIPFERFEIVSMCCLRTLPTFDRISWPILNRNVSGRLWSLPRGNG